MAAASAAQIMAYVAAGTSAAVALTAKQPKLDLPATPTTKAPDEAAQQAARRKAQQAAAAGGRDSTILTGPSGLGDAGGGQRATLLGM